MKNYKIGDHILTTKSYIPISKDERKNKNKNKKISNLNLKNIFFLLIKISFLFYFIIINYIQRKFFIENQFFL